MKPQAVAGIKITINCVMMIMAAGRFYIMRIKQGRRSTYDTFSHILLFSAILADDAACGTNVWVLAREIQSIHHYGIAATNKMIQNVTTLKLLFAAHFFYYLALCVIKLAYLVVYAQLFSRVVGKRRYIMYAAGTIWVQSYVVGFLVIFVWCLPFSGNLDIFSNNPHCPMIFSLPAFLILAVVNILSDLAIAFVPILLISSLRLGKTEKTGLLFVFSVGSISIIASVSRMIVMISRLKAHRVDWDTIHVLMLWCHAEVFFGVLAFMLPNFKYLANRATEKISHLRTKKSDTGYSDDRVQMIPTIGSGRRTPHLEQEIDFEGITDSKVSRLSRGSTLVDMPELHLQTESPETATDGT